MAPKTAVVLVDVLNDFLHPDGKLHGAVAESIETTQMVPNLKHLVDAAREYHVPIYYACHQGWREGMHEGWQHMNSSLARIGSLHAFEEGSWGAQVYEGLEPSRSNGDVVVSKHWNSRYVSRSRSRIKVMLKHRVVVLPTRISTISFVSEEFRIWSWQA